jgi:hypothetical protein
MCCCPAGDGGEGQRSHEDYDRTLSNIASYCCSRLTHGNSQATTPITLATGILSTQQGVIPGQPSFWLLIVLVLIFSAVIISAQVILLRGIQRQPRGKGSWIAESHVEGDGATPGTGGRWRWVSLPFSRRGSNEVPMPAQARSRSPIQWRRWLAWGDRGSRQRRSDDIDLEAHGAETTALPPTCASRRSQTWSPGTAS